MRMNTLKKFTDKKINIRKNTLGSKVLDDILFSFADADGTASVKLAPLCEEASKKAEILLERTLEDGYDKYIVLIEDDVTVYFTSEISKIYALYDIKANYDCGINCGVIYGRAICQMRGLKSYLPPKNEIDDFKRQIDLLLSLGYNTLTLELGGAMEYKSHPEINEGWVEYCQIFKEYSGKSQDVQRMYIYPKTSIHVETGGYDYLTQVQIKSIIDYCYDRHIEIIPETPCLSHADYLLYRHPELSEFADDLLPNNVCPSNEGYYELLFDILDEVVELFKPARINIGHDEAYVIGCCEKCRQKSAADIYAYEVTRIHDYLASKGVTLVDTAQGTTYKMD